MARGAKGGAKSVHGGLNGARSGGGTKRDEIIWSATSFFGRQGYEDTKWADIAGEVGLGSTALYHYFESKLHCLLEIMADALASFRESFGEVTAEHDDFVHAIVAVMRSNFDLTEPEVQRCRVLIAEQGRLAVARSSAREEEARQVARERTRDLELAWSSMLVRGMEQGAIPESDPHLLARAVLGLHNSVWHWYRPRGILTLNEVAEFYVPRTLTMMGVSPEATKAALEAVPLSGSAA